MRSSRSASPLGYAPGDRVGVALDLDGTAYRDGSVFVETMAYLAVGASTLDLDDAARQRLRTAVLEVARYRGGASTRRRWDWTLRALAAAGRLAGPELAGDALERLSRARRTRTRTRTTRGVGNGRPRRAGDTHPPHTGSSDEAAYAAMRRATLGGYCDVLAGRDRAPVERATGRLVRDRLPVDGRLRSALARVRGAGGEAAFVSDAPAHLVRAYAAGLTDDAPVRATALETDEGRYTGEYDSVDKRAALAELRETRDWDYVVAAGDSAVDAGMASVADCFLAVEGQGDGRRRFGELDPVPLADPETLRRELGPDYRAVRVGPGEGVGDALVSVLRAVGVL